MGADDNGNAMIIQQAREDAQDMHRDQKACKMGKMKGHARKVSEKFSGPKTFEAEVH